MSELDGWLGTSSEGRRLHRLAPKCPGRVRKQAQSCAAKNETEAHVRDGVVWVGTCRARGLSPEGLGGPEGATQGPQPRGGGDGQGNR